MEFHLLNIKDITEDDIVLVKEKLPSRYKKANFYKSKNQTLLSIGVGLLMIKYLKPFKEKDIEYLINGKPTLKNNYEFSLSHSGNYVGIALDKTPVGFDIQKIEEKNIKYASKIFKGNELNFFNENPLINFHILWTQKEAVTKLFGAGLAMNFNTFDVTPFNQKKGIKIGNKNIYCLTNKLNNNYIYSVAYIK